MGKIRCKTALVLLFLSLGLSAILKIRCVEHAHQVQLAAAPAWNLEKQMPIGIMGNNSLTLLSFKPEVHLFSARRKEGRRKYEYTTVSFHQTGIP